MTKIIELCNNIAEASNIYEQTNTNLKKRYIIKNIKLFNEIIKDINGIKGTFGTGYPFYALDKDFKETLPIIEEQIRYNNTLLEEAKKSKNENWPCSTCLVKNAHLMPDLKQLCKPCPYIEDTLKPRKLINRLPDIDMWAICDNNKSKEIKELMILKFIIHNFNTSDISPEKTISDICQISRNLQEGKMPNKNLPIDAHLIDYEAISDLISHVPSEIDDAIKNDRCPYLPILPHSYRKKWQKDDEAYNFVHDYLSSLTEFNFDNNLAMILKETRRIIANKYSFSQLYNILLKTGPDSVIRRHKMTKPKNILRERFRERIELWKN